MNYQDYEDLIVILTFAKTKLDKKSKSHQTTANKIDELVNKIRQQEADICCESY